jgi:DNA-binding NarL/FixJ family response regulator
MSEPITVLLADDHALVRQGVRALLEGQGFRVVGEASDGLQAAALIEKLGPRVAVLDLSMPGLGGLDVTRRVARRCPRTRVVILSMHAAESQVLAALRCGASGYVLKGSSSAELATAIREAAAGRRYLGSPLADRAVAAWVAAAAVPPADPYDSLTEREREVLHLAAEGLGNVEVARRLFISPRTAETHRANILRKLGIRGQTELVQYAVRRGLLPAEAGEAGQAGGLERERTPRERSGPERAGPEGSGPERDRPLESPGG